MSHKMRRTQLISAMVIAVLNGSDGSLAWGAPGDIYNLGTLDGYTISVGSAINASGQVTGTVAAGNEYRAFLYTGIPGSGTMAELGTLGGTYSTGIDINAAGEVTGYSGTGTAQHAFRYTGSPGSGGAMVDLGTLGGPSSAGYGINASGQVTGESRLATIVEDRAFLYTGTPGAGGAMADLGTFVGSDINASGQVTGSSSIYIPGGGATRAFLYTGTPGSGGTMVELGTLGGAHSYGLGINDAGQVVGESNLSSSSSVNIWHAFLYTGTPGVNGQMFDLGTLGGTSGAKNINASGEVVGTSYLADNVTRRAFLYTGMPGVDGQMLDLDVWLDATNPTEGAKWTLNSPNAAGGGGIDLNDFGLITGTGTYNDGPGGLSDGTRAYILDVSSLVSLRGDFNNDGQFTAADVDLLCDAIHGAGGSSKYDVNADNVVNIDDLTYEIESILRTTFGDTDTDGDVDLADLGNLASGFEQTGEKRWSHGNFDCDDDVDLTDLGTLATFFEGGSAKAFAEFETLVPEPAAGMLILALMPFVRRKPGGGPAAPPLHHARLNVRRITRPTRLMQKWKELSCTSL